MGQKGKEKGTGTFIIDELNVPVPFSSSRSTTFA
jgi:hypothetical protein